MRLKANGRYAVTAMLDLALAPEIEITSLQMIAERQSISLSYLEQIFTQLKRQGIVNSFKGPGGGYRLGRPASDISIADILVAVGSSIHTTQCKGKENCNDGRKCATHDLWTTLSQQVETFLHSMALSDLLEQQKVSNLEQSDDTKQTIEILQT